MISVDFGAKIISVPKADTTLVDAGPPEIRDYDVYEKLWKELKALEDDADGMAVVDAQRHATTAVIGGVTLAHVVELINGFTVTFEAGSYQVNLKGANHNIADVANMNTVALRSANSAGLIVAGSGVTAQDKLDIADQVLDEVIADHAGAGSLGAVAAAVKTETDKIPAVQAEQLLVAARIYDALMADYQDPGSFGEFFMAVKTRLAAPRPIGKVVVGESTTAFTTDLPQPSDDHWKDAVCLFRTGELAGQVKLITGYDGAAKRITVKGGFTYAPEPGDTFDIVNT